MSGMTVCHVIVIVFKIQFSFVIMLDIYNVKQCTVKLDAVKNLFTVLNELKMRSLCTL